MLTKQDLRRHSRLGWASLVALAAVSLGLALDGRRGAALGTGAALLGCLGLVLPPRERMPILPWRVRALPRRLDAAPVLGTLVSCPGYGLGWFYLPGPYDEIVHLVNGMLAGAVFVALLQADRRRRGLLPLAVAGAAFGLMLGSGWEVFEALTGLIGDWTDTWTDVLLTTLGASFAAALARALDGRRKRKPRAAPTMPRARWHQP